MEKEIEKVIVNEQNLFEFYDCASNYTKILSFYGDADEITKYFQKQFDEKINLKNISYPATMYALSNKNTIYLILSCNSYFFHEKPLKKETLLISMKKYLQDITSNIVILPDNHILENWWNETLTPFDQEYSVIRKMEIVKKKEENLKIEDLDNDIKNIDDILINNTENLKFFNNFSPNIWLYKIYNNKENQEKSLIAFFDKIKRNS